MEDRWAASERLFHEALPLPEADRAAFLDRECAGDAVLRAEVADLLAADRDATEHSVLEGVGTQWLNDRGRGDMVGRRIGSYQLQSIIAYGGMGDVYLADDVALGRRVALKMLPESFAKDPERVRRFTEEARAVSALNHPHIVVIHQIGEEGGRPYLATEFIEGETLRSRLTRGPLSLAETLDIGLQISSAIEAAHAAGIVHRDLKPENVIVRPDGYVKVLDFGLAKRRDRNVPESDATRPGAVMGTPAYMSPEQALGQEVDHRTDVFSLGAVLYEMSTGTPPFRGRTDTEMRASLHRDQSAQHLQFAHTVERAIAKDPDQRQASVTELKNELRSLQRLVDSQLAGTAAAPPRSRMSSVAIAALLALMAVVAALGWLAAGRAPAADPWDGAVATQITDSIGAELFPSVTPDGQSLVYSAADRGDWQIYMQRIGGRTPFLLTPNSPARDTQPAVSPDGSRIAFRSERDGGGIYIMGTTGEAPRRLTDVGFNPTWSPDNKAVAVATMNVERPDSQYAVSELWVIDVESGARRRIDVPDAVQPSWSPDGRFIAYWSIENGVRNLWSVPAGGGTPIPITKDEATDWSPVWSPDGRWLYFCSDRGGTMNVWRVAIDGSGHPSGNAMPVATPSNYSGMLSLTRSGNRLAYVQFAAHTAIMRADFDPALGRITSPATQLSPAARAGANPQISPDGQRVAFSNVGDGQEDLFIVGLDGRNLERLTNDAARDRLPRWSPDGSRIAFFSNRTGKYEIWTMRPDGSDLSQLSQLPDANTPVYSRDGTRMAVHILGDTLLIDPRIAWNAQQPERLPKASFTGYAFSRDGRSLYGWQRVAKGAHPDGIVRYDIASRRHEALTSIGASPFLFANETRALFTHIGELFVLDLASRRVTPVDTGGLRVDAVQLTPDERTIVFSALRDESDVWILDMRGQVSSR
jgi:Tol biopolymer transport system component